MQRRIFPSLLVLIAFFMPTLLFAEETNVIAKSTTIYLADAKKQELQPSGITYIPAGTRLLAFDKTVKYRGLNRRLVLTEDGLWGYVIDSQESYWKMDDFRASSDNSEMVFVRKKFETKVPLSATVSLLVTLTRGETYRLLEDLGDTVKIKIDERKLGNLGGAVAYEVEVPRDVLRIIDLSNKLSFSTLTYFEKSIIDGIAGLEKPSDTKEVSAIRFAEEAGFSFDFAKFFAKIGLDQSYEKKRTEEFGEGVSVTRWYYRRNGRGIYRITKVQDCDSHQFIAYKVVAPGNVEVNLDAEWAKERKLPINERTGQLLVSCAMQYFRLEEELLARGFDEGDLPFIISRTANFTGIGDINACSN